jgi:cation transport protein ChaC
MNVTRNDLEANALRLALADSPLAPHLLSDADLEASLQQTLARRPPGPSLWLFGYGSLVWNPLVRFLERQPGTVRGYHRSFCLWSNINRGTPEQPGLALGLEPGGACRGSLFRIEAAIAEPELRILWRREMLMGSYHPRWVRARSQGETLTALTFVINRDGSNYAGKLSEERIVNTMLCAKGLYGSSAEYLLRTVEGLAHCGIRDARLERLRNLVAARLAARERDPQHTESA